MKRGRGGWRWRELKRRLCHMVFVTYVASDIDALCYYCKVEEGCIFLM